MKTFDDRLWDESDPLYAPGISWSNPNHPRWKAPAKFLKAGYKIKGVRLDGHKGDGKDAERARECRELTRQMVRWYDGDEANRPEPNTWSHLIGRYKADEFSPITRVKANTKAGYIEQFDKWGEIIGHMRIGDLRYETIMRLEKEMKSAGRSVSYISRSFRHLRMLARYGSAIEMPDADRVAMILSKIRFEGAPVRSTTITREQVQKIVEAADKAKMKSFAVGFLICFWYGLRAVDVRGQWLPDDTVKGGKRWQDGLTWDMISRDMATITKTVSKTAKSLPEPYVWDLTPEIRDRLKALPNRVGPVIVSEKTGLPYTTYGWSQAFRRLRDTAGLPKDLWAMDARSGSATDAAMHGVDPITLRNAMQHKNVSTTDKYLRGRSADANRVVQLRLKSAN